ncbi:MAG TPA: hypothetical protein VG826_15960 [Pirellulales bacterium]|nr:hypothetical protein [Pirellulales bacterium]
MIEVMVRQQASGDKVAARRTRNEAIQAGQKDAQSGLYRNLAIADAKAGDYCAAFQALRALKGAAERNRTLVEIAKIQAERGETAIAHTTLAAIVGAASRDEAMVAIGSYQAKHGNIAGALRTAATMKDPVHRTVVLRYVAGAQSRMKRGAAARTTLKQLVEIAASIPIGGGTDTIVYLENAELSAKLGYRDLAINCYERARAAAMRYAEVEYQGSLLRDIAKSEGKVGLTKVAVSTATELPTPFLKAWWLLGLAEGLQP